MPGNKGMKTMEPTPIAWHAIAIEQTAGGEYYLHHDAAIELPLEIACDVFSAPLCATRAEAQAALALIRSIHGDCYV